MTGRKFVSWTKPGLIILSMLMYGATRLINELERCLFGLPGFPWRSKTDWIPSWPMKSCQSRNRALSMLFDVNRVKRAPCLRCFYEACKPAVKTCEVSAPTSDWLKTRLATLREEDVPQKVRIRVDRTLREKVGEIPSILTGHGERTVVRSPSPRLRGEAALATGQRAKASDGVPWRSLLAEA